MVKQQETARILDGKALSSIVRESLKEKIASLASEGKRRPGLAVVLVGDNKASEIYVRNKMQACKQVGIESQLRRFDANVNQQTLLDCIKELNTTPSVDGILVQLPLPEHLSKDAVLSLLARHKDVDGLTLLSQGLLFEGKPGLRPCTPLGIMKLFEHYEVALSGKRAVVIGRSSLVGKPVAMMLLEKNATVTICHSRSEQLDAIARTADVLVVAAGKRAFVPGAWIKPGACVIDVGIHHIENAQGESTICGDVNFAEAVRVAGMITPVPGGVGPMTIAMLLSNTLTAYGNTGA
jgi:methylenetetrahydrofolate dehydrogenase (NADP+)/methenyltetrahydrofolate cyclohydrolase